MQTKRISKVDDNRCPEKDNYFQVDRIIVNFVQFVNPSNHFLLKMLLNIRELHNTNRIDKVFYKLLL